MRRSNKDILLGLVGTLSDKKCKEVYYLIKDLEEPVVDWIQFDKVRLTCRQYSKLIWLWGKDKTEKCISILNEWLEDKKIKNKISHYYNLLGWVENKYNQLYPTDKKNYVGHGKITTKHMAMDYIKGIPKELRGDDRDVRYLVERFGIDINDLKDTY